MRALVKTRGCVAVRETVSPKVEQPDDVVIQVAAAGLCRTDLHVAEGRIPCPDPLVLGHEFAGRVIAKGPAVERLEVGDRVCVFPFAACGLCPACSRNFHSQCMNPRMLGVDRDGAFAELVSVPSASVYPLPDSMPFRWGAYAEPVAASLAVLKASFGPDERGLILGRNRFSKLTQRVLAVHGIHNVTVCESRDIPPELPEYDFAVATGSSLEDFGIMVEALRPRGKIIVKSRPPQPISVDFRSLVRKELAILCVGYGPFEEAIRLMAEGILKVDDLLGSSVPLEDFEELFALSGSDESLKHFFVPGGELI